MLATIAFILIFATLISGVWKNRGVSISLFLASWILIAILFALHSSTPPVTP